LSRTGEGTKPLGFSLAPELSHPKLDHDSSPFDHSQNLSIDAFARAAEKVFLGTPAS